MEATVLGMIFRNEENGYTVLSVRTGKRETSVIGSLPRLSEGEQVKFQGAWVEHPQYGRQFKATGCDIQSPTTLLGIERFLGSGLIHGIGPTTARDIVQTFGEETLTILSEHPERLQEVPRMGKKRWRQVAEAFQEQQQTRGAMVFLQSHGIPAGLSVKISKLYGERTKDIVLENPYRLCDDIEGVGFLTADRIGLSMGIAANSPFRIRSALRYCLREASIGMGHVYLPQDELIRKTAALLRVEEACCTVEMQQLQRTHELTIQQSDRDDSPRVYLPQMERAEKEAAQRLCELIAARAFVRDPLAEKKIAGFEAKKDIRFSDRQKEAIIAALENGVTVITGGPGTGKTTIINCILQLLRENTSRIMLCAPTGRAAKRMTEATGYEAKTIHRMLEYGGDENTFARDQENPVDADCVIVDEMSMVDLMLMRSLLRALEPGTRLIMVGDADQLPSVGAGNVLGDVLQSGVVPTVRLTDIYRQEGSSRIVLNAHRINHGEMPMLNEPGTDFFFEKKEQVIAASQAIVSLVTGRLPKFLHYPAGRTDEIIRNIQVLAPTKKGECGVHRLNALLQAALNPPDPRKASLQYGENLFRVGDKVMQMHNDYQIEWVGKTEDGQGVFNGDIGFVTDVDEDNHTMTVCFDDNREVTYEGVQLENLELAYCMSIHKSQGSEFPVVVMPVVGGPPMLLTRNLFYTALTRARTLVVLVGRQEVIAQMVANNHILKRYTTLTERLRAFGELMP